MAKTKISEFSATPGNNTDIDGINIAEGCAPSGINDAIRELMSQLKDFQTGSAGDSFNGPVGTTTAAAGAFTTLSASSTVSGTGFSTYLASPPAIGGTAAAAGSFTTLSASSTVTLSGGTANGVLYLNGSKVATTGSALTFDGTNFGIGLSASSPLEVQSNSGGTAIRIRGRATANTGTLRFYANDGTTQQAKVEVSDNTFEVGSITNVPFVFNQNGTEQMRLTSTGLGIGTSSPGAKLDVVGGIKLSGTITSGVSGGTPALDLSVGTAAGRAIHIGSAASDAYIGTAASTGGTLVTGSPAYSLEFRNDTGFAWGISSTQVMQLNSSGNVGLGVTPSAWVSVTGFDFSAVASLEGSSTQSIISANQYNDNGTRKYRTTAAATFYRQTAGAHQWFNAASGTAGNAISFTQAMTLDASGQLGIGTSSPSRNLAVYGSSLGAIALQNSSTGTASSDGFQIQAYLTQAYIWNYENDFMSFGTNATERARITSNGQVGIGITPTGSYGFQMYGNGNAATIARIRLQNSSTGSADADGGGIAMEGVNLILQNSENGYCAFEINGSERARIDASGNFGLGVTPSAWSGFRALQVGGATSIWSTTSGGGSSFYSNNVYFDGSNRKRINAGYAAEYIQDSTSGGHLWFTAGTAAAGSTISFTQTMTLDASGNLGIGTSSPAAKLHIGGNTASTQQAILTTGVSDSDFKVVARNGVSGTTAVQGYIGLDYANGTWPLLAGVQFIRNSTSGELAFTTGTTTSATERARIDSSGNFLLGTQSNSSVNGPSVILQDGAGNETFIRINHDSTASNGGWFQGFSYNGTAIGTITQNGTTAVAYNTSSDYRLKDNQQPLTGSGAFIDALKPKTWEWKADGSKGVGFIAHEVQEVSPGSVVGEKDAVDEDGKPIMQAMEYGSAEFIANIIAELQSLRQRVAQLEKGN